MAFLLQERKMSNHRSVQITHPVGNISQIHLVPALCTRPLALHPKTCIPKAALFGKALARAKSKVSSAEAVIGFGTSWGYNLPIGAGGLVKEIRHLTRVEFENGSVVVKPDSVLHIADLDAGGAFVAAGAKINDAGVRDGIAAATGLSSFLGDMESSFMAELDLTALFRVAVDNGEDVTQEAQENALAFLADVAHDWIVERFGAVGDSIKATDSPKVVPPAPEAPSESAAPSKGSQKPRTSASSDSKSKRRRSSSSRSKVHR